jgi:cell division protein FtsL
MIKINLVSKRRKQSVTGGGSTQSFDMNSLMTRLEGLKGLPLTRLLTPLAIGIVAAYGLDYYEQGELHKLDVEIESINSEKPKLQAEIQKKQDYENLKKAMESDELIMRRKLDTIQKLNKGRTEAVQAFIALSKATPPSIWLTSFSVKDADAVPTFGIKGVSTAMSQIPAYQRALDANPIFHDLNATSRSETDKNGSEVYPFELSPGVHK